MNMMKKTVIASGVALALTAGGAQAAAVNDLFGDASFTTNVANFTMLSGAGYTVGGTNDVSMTWDGDAFSSSSDYTGIGSSSNVTASSTSTFFGHNWAAHDIQVFVPGSYSFDTTLGGGAAEVGMMNVTVPAGSIGMHMLFDWNGVNNIDVFVVAASGSMYGNGVRRTGPNAVACDGGAAATTSGAPAVAGIQNCLWMGGQAGFTPAANQIWMLATVDGNGDGIMGIPMQAGGPFAGFNAGFNANMNAIADVGDHGGGVNPVPVPAAAWLFGSGLLGLAGIARRKAK